MRTRREHVGEGGAGVAALFGVEVPCGGIRFDVGCCALWSTSGIWMDGCTQGRGCTHRRHPFSLRTMHPLEYVGEPLGARLKHLQAPAHREREEPLPVPLRRVVRVCWVRVCMCRWCGLSGRWSIDRRLVSLRTPTAYARPRKNKTYVHVRTIALRVRG